MAVDPPPMMEISPEPPFGPRRGRRTLGQKAMRGSAFTFVGFGLGQFIRLAGNVIVARLLAPEMFGIMVIVWVLMFALTMLSDVGSGHAVIRHKRGDEPRFLNTAWTMQVIRGVIMAVLACAMAWPMALIFKEPLYILIIPVVGFTAILDGFVTMKIYTATRHLALGRQTLVELLSQTGGVVTMVCLALATGSIWSLVFGMVVTRLARLVLAQLLLPGLTNSFCWEPEAVRQLVRFGKWILSSSILMLIGQQLDKPVIALLDPTKVTVGIYDRAGRLGEPFVNLNMRLARKVLYPAMSSVHRDRPQAMKRAFYRARLAMDATFMPMLGGLMVVAPIVVSILYDARYAAAGWMLQILLLRIAMQCIVEPGRECLVALNKPQYALWLTIGRTVWVLIGLPVGWWLGGLPGLILAMALAEIPAIAVVWFGMARYHLLNLQREGLTLLMLASGALAGWGFHLLWHAYLLAHWLGFEAWLRAQWSAGGA